MPDERLEKLRDVARELDFYDGMTGAGTGNGLFRVWGRGAMLTIVASADEGEGWEHVSVSTQSRCPTWEEMCAVKTLFWLPTESVMQLHPPESEWVNNHPYCLHMWRPTVAPIPMPPSIYVGVKSAGILKSPEHARAVREEVLRGEP